MSDPRANDLLNILPSVFREDSDMADFLAAFENILLAKSRDATREKSLEVKIDELATHIDPALARVDDLRWLAGWLGLTIDADYPTGNEEQYRIFVARTMSRYQQRGTLAGMKTLLEQFTGQPSAIRQDEKAHGFIVSLNLDSVRDVNEMERLTRVAHALIQREKPAHTHYELKTKFQTFQVANLSRSGGQIQPRPSAKIVSPAQVGRREDGKIKVGNMMLGQAPLNASKTKPKASK
ncbi:phage tail protein [Herbaspirillum rhizosphaerae]|uniref:phage tail protein n=1 Tax=Herbaspirillum rhizosphaerae TaxID=346179 RepID=UPI00067ADB8F|nr:phage tail protein [Herbaspirillum rhizosphaerae]